MLTSIHIKGFKGFKDTQIEPLRKVNVILGGQNVGKTSLLEAVYFGARSPGEMARLPSVFRLAEGHDTQRYLQAVFKDTEAVIQLTSVKRFTLRTWINSLASKAEPGKLTSGVSQDGIKVDQYVDSLGADFSSLDEAVKKLGLSAITPLTLFKSLDFADPLAVSVHLPDQMSAVQLFDKVVMSRKKKRLLGMLRGIEPRLEDMHSLSPDGEQRIYVELDGHVNALPLPQLGHGFSRLVYLYCSLLVTEAKLALIDEIENGIHYSSLPTLFQGIQDIAIKHDVQTMMTTHSWECIRAAYNVFAEAGSLKDFQLIRLEREGDNIRAVVINDENLATVMEAGYEVR
jgi:hypothetical protein